MVNPITHLVTATRGLMHGDPVVGEIGWVLVACAALVAMFGPVTMRLYRREREPHGVNSPLAGARRAGGREPG